MHLILLRELSHCFIVRHLSHLQFNLIQIRTCCSLDITVSALVVGQVKATWQEEVRGELNGVWNLPDVSNILHSPAI